MKISLVTVSFNAVATITDAFQSVWKQKLPDGVALEYIVVDGGSTDGTVDVIRAMADRVVREGSDGMMCRWISEPDHGLYDAINKGIRMATGDVIGILNADDWMDGEDVIASVVREFGMGVEKVEKVAGVVRVVRVEKVERVDCVYGDIRFVRNGKTVRYYSAKRWKPWMFQWGKMPPHPGVYIRRECFEKFGNYKLGYKIAADYELLVRFLRKHAIRAKYLDKCLVCMTLGGLSTKNWKSNLLLNQEIVRGNRENGYFCCLPMLLPKYAFKIWEVILPRMGVGRG